MPPTLWKWITDRGDYRKDPSVNDQFDVLLKVLVGRSLKEEAGLWESHRNLRDARNSFVHNGEARAGDRIVDGWMATALVDAAGKIIETVRSWLPPEFQWVVFAHEPQVQVEFLLARGVDPTGPL